MSTKPVKTHNGVTTRLAKPHKQARQRPQI